MSVIGFQKKVWIVLGGWGELYPSFFGFLEFLTAKPLSKYTQQTCLSDCRILVERILNTVLVPYSLEPADRMKRLYTLYACVDDHSVK